MLKHNKSILRWLKLVICLIIIIFGLGYCYQLLINNFSQSQLHNISFRWDLLTISIILAALHFFCINMSWHVLTKIFDCALPLKLSLPIWSVTFLGRYIPGKVPYLMGRIMAYQSCGANLGSITIVAILDNLFYIFVGTVVACFTLIFLHPLSGFWKIGLLIGVALQSVIMLNPHICRFVLSKIAKIKSLKLDESKYNVTFNKLLKVFFIYLLSYLPLALGLYLFVRSFAFIPFEHIFFLIGGFAFAIVLGIIAVLTPSGLGVREGSFAWLLRYFVAPELAAIISIAARIWLTVAELLYLLITIIWFMLNYKSLHIFKKISKKYIKS